MSSQQILFDDIEIEKTKYTQTPMKKEYHLDKKIDVKSTSESDLNSTSKSLDAQHSYNLYINSILEEFCTTDVPSIDIQLIVTHITALINESSSFINSLDGIFEGLYWFIVKYQSNESILKIMKKMIHMFHHHYTTIQLSEPNQQTFFSCYHKLLMNIQPFEILLLAPDWVDFITPQFIENRMKTNQKEFVDLLKQLLSFINTFATVDKILPQPLLLLYTLTIRLFAILRHDYSQFLSEYFIDLLECLSYKFGQLRSIILTATPPNIEFSMGIPFNENKSVHLQPTIKTKMSIPQMTLIDIYMSNGDEKYLPIIMEQIDPKYYLQLCVYLAIKRENKMYSDSISQLLYYLVFNLSVEKRTALLNAMIDNIRFANAHTLYYCIIVQMLFSCDEIIAEQIVTLLVQRLITTKPLPLGVVITFLEMMNVKRYDLLNKKFMKEHKYILNLFQKMK